MQNDRNDVISRQAAIDLWERYHPYIATKAMEYDEALKALPTVQPQTSMLTVECKFDDEELAKAIEEVKKANLELIAAEPHWIPCSERLPEYDFTDVLVCYHDQRTGCEDDYYIMQAYVVRGHWCPTINTGCMDYLEPVAWMPLPEPWREGQDE